MPGIRTEYVNQTHVKATLNPSPVTLPDDIKAEEWFYLRFVDADGTFEVISDDGDTEGIPYDDTSEQTLAFRAGDWKASGMWIYMDTATTVRTCLVRTGKNPEAM